MFSSQRRRSIQFNVQENMSSGSAAATNEPTQPHDLIGTQQSQTRQPSNITSHGSALSASISRSNNVHVGNLGNVTNYMRTPQSSPANRPSSSDRDTQELDCVDGNLI